MKIMYGHTISNHQDSWKMHSVFTFCMNKVIITSNFWEMKGLCLPTSFQVSKMNAYLMSAMSHNCWYSALRSVCSGEPSFDCVCTIVNNNIVTNHSQLFAFWLHFLNLDWWLNFRKWLLSYFQAKLTFVFCPVTCPRDLNEFSQLLLQLSHSGLCMWRILW